MYSPRVPGQRLGPLHPRDLLEQRDHVPGVGGWALDLQSNSLSWSDETCRIHGVEPGYRPRFDEAVACYTPSARRTIQRCIDLAVADGVSWDIELALTRADGEHVHVRAVGTVDFLGDTPIRLSGAVQDISDIERSRLRMLSVSHEQLQHVSEELSRANERLHALSLDMNHRACHDSLTDLFNRSGFEARLKQLHHISLESACWHTLLFIDLDRFWIVNQCCGHVAGDRLLQEVGGLLDEFVGTDDTLARLGGDEFGLLLVRCGTDRAGEIGRQICQRLNRHQFFHQGQRFRIGVSIGLVPIEPSWADVSAILCAAETACHAAKEAGRNRLHEWCATDPVIHARHLQSGWLRRIESALDEYRFELFAQRIGTPGSLAVFRHAEVLLRLFEGSDERILPGAFLPAAERLQLVSRIDSHVLKQVITWLGAHRMQSDIDTLWINLSGQSVGDRQFQEDVLAQLADAGDEVCHALCFEITETHTVPALAAAARFIDRIRALGVQVALDDFGAGASTFSYLKNLPVDYLKIDGQFVRDVIDNPLDRCAVRCFTDAARVMGVKIVAEFVETDAVLAHLEKLGVDLVQGWLLHRPEPIDELLHSWPRDHQL